jgi:parallel beta-helix repeat protein
MRRHPAGWAGALCRPLFRSKTSRGRRRRVAEPLRRRPADFIPSLGFIEGLERRAMLAVNISLIGSELTIHFQGTSAEFAEVGRLDATTYQVTDSDGDTLMFNVADVESILAYGEPSTEHRLTITELSAEPITAGLIVNPTVRLTEIKAAFAIPTRPAGKGGVFVESPEILLTNDITTTHADVNFAFPGGGALTLDGDISIDTGAGDGNITFGTTVDVLSSAPGATLTLATGAGGVVFDAAIGGTKPLQGIAVLSGSGVIVGATATISLDGTAPGFTPFADGLAIAAGVNNAQFTAGGSIANFPGAGVLFAGSSTNSTISGFAIGGNGQGVKVAGGATPDFIGSQIVDNVIGGLTTPNGVGIELVDVATAPGAGLLIAANQVAANTGRGIVVQGSTNHRIIGNIVTGNGAEGISILDGSHGTLAYSNAVSGSAGTGIFVKDSSTLGAPVQVGAALDFGVGGIPAQLILAGDQTGLIFAGQTIGLVAPPAGTVPPELRTVTAVDFDSGVTVVTIDGPTALTSGLLSLGNIVSTNGLAGIVLSTGGGGASTAARITGNLVTDSKSQGIALLNDPGNAATALSGAEVVLNLVGGDGAGNGADGVLVSWADGTVINTNQIEANGLNGVNLVNAGAGPQGTTVENNTISGHGFSGIQVFADKVGSYAGAILGNYSHANAGNGLVFYQTAVVPAVFPVEVRGNVIGVTPTGTPAGNTLHGIQLNPANYAGAVIAGNRVEFNSLWGLYLNATSSAPVADAQIGQLAPFEVVSSTMIRVPLDRTDWFHPPWQVIGLQPPSLGSVTPSLPGLVRTVVGDYYDSGDDHTYVTLDAPIDGVEPGWSLSLANTLRQNSGYGLVVNGAVTGTSVVGNLITLNSSVGAFLNEATGLELTANGIADNPFAGLFAAGDLSDTVASRNWIGRSSGIATQSVGVQLLGAQGLSLDMNAVVNNVVYAVVASGASTGTKLTSNVVSGSAMGLVLDAATGLGVGQAAAGNQFGRPVTFTSSLQGTSLVVSGDERLGFEVGSVVAIRPAADPEWGTLRIIQSVSYAAGSDTTTIVIDGAYDNASTAGELLARNWIAGVYGQGTLTGTALEGNLIEGNTYGIYLTNSATGLRTGATTGEGVPDATGNVVAYNAIHGALVIGVGSLGNPFVSNAFYLNGQQGIFLFDGGNGNLPRPVLAAATRIGGVVRVSGTFSAPEGIYRLQFFRNVAGDVPAPLDVFGFEGRQLVQAGGGSGFLDVAVGPSGTASFLADVPGTAVVNGEWITSTASSLLGGLPFNTSFFSPGVQVV